MFDGVGESITAIITALLSKSDGAIGAVCSLAWSSIFPPLAGIVLGFTVLSMFFRDDLAGGVGKALNVLVPLFIVAWLIKGGNSCKLIDVKKDVQALSQKVATAVGGEFGGDTGKVAGKVADSLANVTKGLWEAARKGFSDAAGSTNSEASKK